MSILVVGSIAYDTVETPRERRERIPGGSATFFCHAAHFFGPTRLVGVVGDDFLPEHLDMLRGLDVDLEGLKIAPGKTFAWGGRYEQQMNIRTTLFTELGVFADFAPELPPAYRASEYVFLANIHPDLQHRVLDQVEKPKFVAADSMNLWIDIARDSLVRLLPRLDMLVINDEEAAMLTGEAHLPRALRALLTMGPRRIIVKRGEYGVIMAGPEGFFIAPAWPVDDVADPTGAGDSFAGGFMGSLAAAGSLDDAALRRAIAYGSAVGSFAVEKFSYDRFLTLTRAEIDDRVWRFRELSRFELA